VPRQPEAEPPPAYSPEVARDEWIGSSPRFQKGEPELSPDKAAQQAAQAEDPKLKESYQIVAQNCANIIYDPPQSYHEALQWIMLYMIVERINGHGNGYGRFDQLLNPFYQKDKTDGLINRERARELLAEWYLKYGPHLSYGGRLQDGSDATNEMSWIGVEAYDMVGGYGNLTRFETDGTNFFESHETFKKAIGTLYKQKLITIKDDGIYLN
jgi:hypothetical protein